MHIADGILPLPVVAGGMAVMAAGVALGMRKLDLEAIPKTGVVTAGLFVASLVHIPVGPGSVHPLMIGAAGILLGWPVFPAYLIALLLQVLFFGFGGLFMLGVNTVIMACPALIIHYVFRFFHAPGQGPRSFMLLGGLCGGAGILLSGLAAMSVLLTVGRSYAATAQWILAAHIPVMIGEAFITAALLHFVRQVRPDLLPQPLYRGNATV
ncbi:MAG: cobalt transporter CbiM [Candidatus Hydrogenedentes bacterium]|nr:cobalt transporter CbiM [Candidatus Hydrogenedentota bacterium]